MIRLLSSMAVVLAVGSAAHASNDDKYYQIESYTVTDVTADYQMQPIAQPGLVESCDSNLPILPRFTDVALDVGVNPLDVVEVYVDQIINIGKKIFDIVAAGRPVVNVNLDTANALPKGLTCWSDLSGWNMPNSKVYKISYKNGLGMSVVDFSYRVTFTAGGSADGVGQYITNATFMPANLSVAWGFQFDANAVIPSVLNTGTREAPVAGMQMNMDWKVTSPMSHQQASETFFATGANVLTKLQ